MNLSNPQTTCSCCFATLGERQYWCSMLHIKVDELEDSFDLKLCEDCYAQVERAIWQMLRQNLRAASTKLQAAGKAVGLEI